MFICNDIHVRRCNKEYPISNFAAMWPTDEVGATQTTDVRLLATAKQTVFALNKYQAKPWANVNGFCLSWPPAVRVSGREDAELLVTSFATAIESTTGNNLRLSIPPRVSHRTCFWLTIHRYQTPDPLRLCSNL
eukprot:COSAG06_NODE_3188_length_5711_cov_19.904490_4_plen_134_part_00